MAAEEGRVVGIHFVEGWKDQIQRGVTHNKLVVVAFTASWCPTCGLIAPFVVELAKKFPRVIFLKVDIDELKEIVVEWNVEAVPTFVFIEGGKEVHRHVGTNKEKLQKKVEELATAVASA